MYKQVDDSLEISPTGVGEISFNQKSVQIKDRQKLGHKVAHLVSKSKKNSRDFDIMKISEAQKSLMTKYNETLAKNIGGEYSDAGLESISTVRKKTERTARHLVQNKSERAFIVSPQLNSIRKK